MMSTEDFIRGGCRSNPWIRLPGWHISMITFDWLHIIDLTLIPDAVGSALLELTDDHSDRIFPGNDQESRLRAAYVEFSELCKQHGIRYSACHNTHGSLAYILLAIHVAQEIVQRSFPCGFAGMLQSVLQWCPLLLTLEPGRCQEAALWCREDAVSNHYAKAYEWGRALVAYKVVVRRVALPFSLICLGGCDYGTVAYGPECGCRFAKS